MTAVKPYSSLDVNTVVAKNSFDSFSPMEWDDYAIKGRMVVASLVFDESKMIHMSKDEIKKNLAVQLADEMLSGSYIDYTQSNDLINLSVMVRARAFVLPNGDVQLLRTLKK